MNTRLLVFLTTAREGHLTGAARQLNLSISAVSHQISQLEADFATPLFIRGNRGMRLTPAGETLFQYANQIEAIWQKAYRDVRQKAANEQRIHLSASYTATEYLLPGPLGLFRNTYPTVHLYLNMSNSTDVINQVETGQVDFGIAEGRIGHRQLHVTELWDDRLGVIVSQNHPWANNASVSLSDVLHSEIILREEGSGTRSILQADLQHHNMDISDLHIIAELSSMRAILSLVANEVGIAILSALVTHDHPGVRFIPIDGLQLTRKIHLIYRESDDMDPMMDRLIQMLTRTAKQFNKVLLGEQKNPPQE
ncbi:MAG: LysR family transcriptional regulator [Firmicutes bacterium]|nr:LysR family transcriptional regulator [Bacillota bacterium]